MEDQHTLGLDITIDNTNMGSNMEPNIENTGSEYKLEEIDNFDNMGLKLNLHRGVYSYGFTVPSPIQQKSIKPITDKKDLIAQAPSGTGKTGSFTIGALQVINEKLNKIQAIFIAPTRELAIQINSVINHLGQHMKIKTCLSVGKMDVRENIRNLKDAHIIVGTPGRIEDLIEQHSFDCSNISILVMDEADVLLKDDFVEQIKYIISVIPRNTQICLFSATMPPEMIEMTSHFMRKDNLVKIMVEPEKLTLDGIKQYYIDAEKEHFKSEILLDLYKQLKVTNSIIFVNKVKTCEYLRDFLYANSHTVSVIHGKLTQDERNSVMADFRRGACRILIATDILARGIDVQHVNLVINYDLPDSVESYLHRIGRSGRYGRKGISINLITYHSKRLLDKISEHYKTDITELPEVSTLDI